MTEEFICPICGELIIESRTTLSVEFCDSERGWLMQVHASCLSNLLAANVPPLAANQSRVPGDAKCGVCGRRLPIIGRHPFVLVIYQPEPSRQWFVHAECFPPSVRAHMTYPENRKS
jgi:hypothetical protein